VELQRSMSYFRQCWGKALLCNSFKCSRRVPDVSRKYLVDRLYVIKFNERVVYENSSICHFWAGEALPTMALWPLRLNFRSSLVYIICVYLLGTSLHIYSPSMHGNYAKSVEHLQNCPSLNKSFKFHSFFTYSYGPMRILNANPTVIFASFASKNWRRYSTNTKDEPKSIKICRIWKKNWFAP